jgi:predicted small secreted protein
MKKNKFAIIALMLMAVASTCTLSACNTMSGLGKDVKATGDAIDDEARENKTY